MLRLALRRDRVRLSVWVVVLAGSVVGTASALAGLYPTLASRQELAVSVGQNPAIRALTGPTFDLTQIGGLTAWRMGAIAAVLAGLMSLLTVVRHTRAEEEAGRLELVGSSVVGRNAPLAAALAVAVVANAGVAATTIVGLVGLGLPLAGSLALGLSVGAAGLVFAAVSAAAAQLTGSARAASGMAGGVLGFAYLLRAAGDGAGKGGATWLSWLSPIGWAQQTRPFAGERWWVFALAGTAVVVLLGVATALLHHRDHGSGILAARAGPPAGGPALAGPLGLAWRLHRGPLLAWTSGVAVAGVVVGGVAEGVGDLVGDNERLGELLTRMGGSQAIVDAYLASTLGLVGLVAGAFSVQTALRLRSEEGAFRAEPVLATKVGRAQWVLSHLALAVAGPVVLLASMGLTTGLVHGLRTGEVATEVPRMVGAALAQAPATWVLAALAVALFGLAPQRVVAAWAALLVCVLVAQLGPVLELDQWMMDLSPFSHVPAALGATWSAVSALALVGVAAALTIGGLLGFRQRDVG